GGFTIDRSFNQDASAVAGFGPGWAFSVGESLTPDSDGSLRLQRGSGRVDRFTSAAGASTLFAVTGTNDTLVRNSDGGYTLRSANGTRVFSRDGRLLSLGGITPDSNNGRLGVARYAARAWQFRLGEAGRVTPI